MGKKKEENNIIKPFIDVAEVIGKLGLKSIYKLLKIKEYYDIEEYFKKVELKNKQEHYPKTIKIYESKKGYTYLINVPVGLNEDDFKKHKKSLEVQLKKNIEVKLKSGFIEIEVIEKELPTKINYVVPEKKKESIYIPFADSLDGSVYLDLRETPHTLCTGTTGGGKSITTRNIITSILNLYPEDVNLYLIDFKVVELAIFENIKQCKCYINDVEGAKEVISDIMEECLRRYKLFKEIGVTNIYDYNEKVSKDKRLKFEFIVIEEFIMLLQDKKKIAMTILKQLASLSRASGQFLYITAQRFDNTVIDIVLRSVIGNRICHLVESENDSKLIIDTVGADKLRGNGHILFKNVGKVKECQGYYITDDEVRSLTKKYEVTKDYTNKMNNDINMDTNIKEQKEISKQTNDKVIDLSFIDKL